MSVCLYVLKYLEKYRTYRNKTNTDVSVINRSRSFSYNSLMAYKLDQEFKLI